MRKTRATWSVALALATTIPAACSDGSEHSESGVESQAIDDALENEIQVGALGAPLMETGGDIVACDPQDPEFGCCTSTAEKTGPADLDTDSDLLSLQKARDLVRKRLYDPVQSQQFVNCLRDGILSSTNTYPEQLHRLLKEAIPTKLQCRYDLVPGTDAQAGHELPPSDGSSPDEEIIYFGPTYLRPELTNQQRVNLMAELTIHELTHTKGYYLGMAPRGSGHPGPEVDNDHANQWPCAANDPNDSGAGGTCIERTMAAAVTTASCLFDNRPMDWVPNLAPPNAGRTRSEMAATTGEVTLAPVGNIINREQADENTCTTNEVGVGIRGRFNNYVPSLAMICRNGAGVERGNDRTGAITGTGFSFTCPNNEVLVGVSGQAGMWLNAIKPICQTTTANLPTYGGNGGGTFERRCPAGHAVKGLRLRYSEADGYITRTDVVCQKVDQLSDIRTELMGTLGPAGGDARDDEHCPSKSVMTKLWGIVPETTDALHGRFLMKLGAGCSTVTTSGGFGTSVTVSTTGAANINHMLPFRGRRNINEKQGHPLSALYPSGLGKTGECPSGQALIGVLAASESGASVNQGVTGIKGVCVNAAAWSQATAGSTLPPESYTAALGTGTLALGTFPERVVCNPGRFMTGWRISEEPNVTNIRPRCRRF